MKSPSPENNSPTSAPHANPAKATLSESLDALQNNSRQRLALTIATAILPWLIAGFLVFYFLLPQDHSLAWPTGILIVIGASYCASRAWIYAKAMHRLEVQASAFSFAQRAAEAQTRLHEKNEAQSLAILRTMRDGMVHIDDHGTILSVNDAIESLFGYEHDELIGCNVSLLVAEPHRSAHDGYLSRYLETRHSSLIGRRLDVVAQRKDGSQFEINLAVNELVDDTGSSFLGLIRDITEQKTAQRKLEAALLAAQAATQARSEFLANMSHEIRTPINAVLGFSDLCLRGDLNARCRDYISNIHTAANALLHVINDILDFSKIEAGELVMEKTPFSLDETLNHVASLFNLKARQKHIELIIGALPNVPDHLIGDPLRLGQVLINLLSNALKFTENGEIVLTVELISKGNDTVNLRFSVRDTGLGMNPEQLEKLFAPFTQADSSTTRKFGGTGLGLVISKQLVERMGGQIQVSSETGTGSCFSFTAHFGADENVEAEAERETKMNARLATDHSEKAPAQSGADSHLDSHLNSRLKNKRVLVVDDNAAMCALLTNRLETIGCQTETLSVGHAVLPRLQTQPDIDLILLDWHIPEPDGLATARSIRTAGITTPIVLITGDDPDQARTQTPEGDIQAFLAKPIHQTTLYNTLSDVLMGRHEHAPPSLTKLMPAPDLSGAKILLVDDNEFNRQVGRDLIALTGASVDTANDGAAAFEAVNAATSATSAKPYDLILMDLQMPVMDGYAAARLMRLHWPNLPILALTAHAIADEKARVLAAGMNDILTKPILSDVLYTSLAHWLKSAKAAAPLLTAPAQPAEPALKVETSVIDVVDVVDVIATNAALPNFDLPGFDIPMALARVNNNWPMLEKFLRMFRERNANSLSEIGTALTNQDLTAAKRLAHTLKGVAATLGAVTLAEAASRFESALVAAGHSQAESDSAKPDDFAEDFATLEAEWRQTLTTLDTFLESTSGKTS